MLNCSEYSDRQVRRAVKAQEKDLKKIRKCRASIDETNTMVDAGTMNARLGDAYNQRDQKRIDKYVDRIAARSKKFELVDGFPNGLVVNDGAPRKTQKQGDLKPIHRTPKQDAAAEKHKAAKAVEVEVSDVEASARKALCDEARALYDRGAITEAALQLAFDVADSGDINAVCRSAENLRGATRRADKLDAA